MDTHPRFQVIFAVLVCATLLFVPAAVVTAQDKAEPKLDAKAQSALQSMSDFYSGMDSLTLVGGAKITREIQGQSQDLHTKFNFAMQRPNHFAMTPTGPDADRWSAIVVDGEKMTIYVGQVNKYTVDDAPKTLDALMSNRLVGMLSGQVGQVVGALMTSDPYQRLMQNVVKAEHLGTVDVDGRKAHHLRVSEPQISWEAWIAAGDKPELLKVKPDMSPIEQRAREAGQDVKLSMMIYTEDLNAGAKLGEQQFAFSPPAGAEKVDSFFKQPQARDQHPMVGKPAPAFELAKLDGSEQTLAAHKGKDIVILDFWATWCGPCVRAMPVLEKVAGEYKDKNVVLYAVNLREDKPKIEAFLKKQGLDVNVLMDKQGAVANKYGVRGIPQTVIIDPDGTVQVVHVGFAPDLEAQLTSELDDLTAGKKLAN